MKSQRGVSGVSFAFSLVVIAYSVQANPVGETVVGGAARFERSPGRLTINQGSDRLIVNWRSFSIGAGETTKFVQPSANSAALNRVLSGDPSRIYGNLEANGRVFVINPNGVLVGKGATINTHGFVASTLDISDASFLSGAKLTLSGDSTASVVNEGAIEAIGGDVFLIGRTVENSGSIRAANGTVGLAAGNEVVIVPTGRERVSVIAGNADGAPAGTGVKNVGTIEAVSAELKAAGGNIYALAINNGGIVRATGVRREGGRVFLTSDGGDIGNSGTISARNADGSGGTVFLAGGHNAENPATVINSGVIEARGDAEGTRGGQVRLTGDHVGLFGSGLIDVSGHSGGGVALIGGGYQGSVSSIQNADRTFIGEDAVIKADATVNGNGGRVIVWANGVTRFYGNISARGGASGGNGGFAEVSGKDSLEYRGTTDLSAPLGRTGSLLLDPKFIIIATTGTDPVGANDEFAENAAGTSTIAPSALVTALNTADVTLRANTDITITDAVDASGNGNVHGLTLRAGRSILDDANITIRGTFSATFNDAGADAVNRDAGAATFTMANGTTITAPGGITIQGGSLADQSDGLGGTVTVGVAANTGNIQIGGLDTHGLSVGASSDGIGGGTVSVVNNAAAGKNVTVAGTIDSRGSDAVGPGNQTGGAGGNVTVTASGTVTVNGVNTSGGLSVGTPTGGSAGDIALTGGSGITLAGDITAHAGTGSPNGNDGTLTLTATAGGVTQTGGAIDVGSAGNAGDLAKLGRLVLAGAGTFRIDRNGNDLPRVTADVTGPIQIRSGGDLTVQNQVRSGNSSIDIATENGSITVANDVAGADLDAGTGAVTLSAGSSGSDNAIIINGGVAATGGITFEADHMTLAPDASGIQVGTATAAFLPFEAGTLIDFGGADAAGTLGLTDGELGDVTAGTITVGSGTAGAITASADVSLAGSVNVNLISGGGISFDNGVRLTTAGNVSLQSGGAIAGNGGGANVDANALSATAQSGITLDTAITTLTLASVGGTGDINISDAGGLAVTAAVTSDGSITLSTSGGNLDVTSATAGGNGRNINLTTTTSGNVGVGAVVAAGDTVTINAADSIDELGVADPDADITAATVSLTAGTGIGGAGTLEIDATTLSLADVTGTGGIDLSDISGGLAVTTATTTGGDITLNTIGGNLAVATATAGGGSSDINLSTTTSGDVQVGNVTANNDVVTINSAGAIEELGADAGADITADTVSLTAATGIGAAGTLELNATTLSLANVTGIGAIDLSDTAGGLAVTLASTFDGAITLNAIGGDLDVASATANGTGRNVALSTTTSGDVKVGNVTAADDTVTVVSAGAIEELGPVDAGADITAATVSLTAASGIGAAGTLEIDATTLSLANVTGAGAIDLSDVVGGLLVTAATTANGDITLNAIGGSLDVVLATANGASRDITLGTTTSGDVNVGNVTASGDAVTVTSAGAIEELGPVDAAPDISADSISLTAGTGIGLAGELEVDATTLNASSGGAVGHNIVVNDTAGGVQVGSINAGAANVFLTATDGSITSAADDNLADIIGATINLTIVETAAGNHTIGESGGDRLEINATTALNAQTQGNSAGDSIFLTDTAGGVEVGTVTAGQGNVTLTARDGSITSGADDNVADITGANISLAIVETAPGEFTIGESATDRLEVSSSSLTAQTEGNSAGDALFISAPGGLTGLSLNSGLAGIDLLAAGTVTDTDLAVDVAGAAIEIRVTGVNNDIGSSANPIAIGGTGGGVLLTSEEGGVHVAAQSAGTPDVIIQDSGVPLGSNLRTRFNQGGRLYDVRTDNSAQGDLTIQSGGDITGAGLAVPAATLTLRAAGEIGGGFTAPLSIDAGTFAGSAGTGLAVEDSGDLTLGNISTTSGNFFIRAGDTLTLNGGTSLSAGAGNVILVADGAPGISVAGVPMINSRFLLYAVNASLTDPPVIRNQQGKPAIGGLVADVLNSPRNFNAADPDPFGDTSDYFVFRAEANPPTDPSLFIDIPMELYRPVSINFGEYDPTKFGEVGDLWMSSSELYEMERKAKKAPKPLPGKVDKSKYVTESK